MGNKVLITGASGLIGAKLVNNFIAKGYQVNILGRSKVPHVYAESYLWDVQRGTLDMRALDGVSHIVHMAGANIAEGRWSKERRNEIVSSRIDTAALLYNALKESKIEVESFVTASAVGFYGQGVGQVCTEDTPAANDFLGQTCLQWEQAADQFESLGARVVKVRIGVVLATTGGALPKLAKPVRFGLGAGLGSGKQCMPWIHVDDLLAVFVRAVEDVAMFGAYNSVSPNQLSHNNFMREVAQVFGKRIILPNVPAALLRMGMGEMADVVLGGNEADVSKLLHTGFQFKHANLAEALHDLLVPKDTVRKK